MAVVFEFPLNIIKVRVKEGINNSSFYKRITKEDVFIRTAKILIRVLDQISDLLLPYIFVLLFF